MKHALKNIIGFIRKDEKFSSKSIEDILSSNEAMGIIGKPFTGYVDTKVFMSIYIFYK